MPNWSVDYPGAIQVEAANYGYGASKNNPKGFVYHTPEEKADDDPQTPRYLANTTRLASYHYFVSYLGFIFQLVPESEGAYANYVTAGKTYPVWSSSSINLNLQSISVSFEGEAHNIHATMPRGSPQWKAGVDLVAHRAQGLNIDPDNWVGHKDVSVNRGDPGSLDVNAFVQDVKAKIEEEDMPTIDEIKTALRPIIKAEAINAANAAADVTRRSIKKAIVDTRGWRLIKGSKPDVYLVTQGRKRHVFSSEAFKASGYGGLPIDTVTDAVLANIPDA